MGLQIPQLCQGILKLLSTCPSEAAQLRKELLIAIRHILTTELKQSNLLFVYFKKFRNSFKPLKSINLMLLKLGRILIDLIRTTKLPF